MTKESIVGAPRRFTALRKAEILTGIRDGKLTRRTARRRYDISPQELAEWEAGYRARGLEGLMVTKRTKPPRQ